MDEVEVIQNYLLTQAGADTDVILGMGYDNNLGNKLGITLIATGFEHKDPFAKATPKKQEPKKEEKIIMVLGQAEQEKSIPVSKEEEQKEMPVVDPLAPTLVEIVPVSESPVIDFSDIKETDAEIIHWELSGNIIPDHTDEKILSNSTDENHRVTTVGKLSIVEKNDSIISGRNAIVEATSVTSHKKEEITKNSAEFSQSTPVSAASGGYLARPSNIYAESKAEVFTSMPSAEEPVPSPIASSEEEELLELQMQLVERDDIPAADMPLAHQVQPEPDSYRDNREPLSTTVEESREIGNETEEQKRRAAERLQKLRNLSFNVNAADPNNEFETVPAYIRRNMELYNNNSQVENFYSNYEVKTDNKNQSHISTINTFLDGKKPD
jgi:cell division protein FtsZ